MRFCSKCFSSAEEDEINVPITLSVFRDKKYDIFFSWLTIEVLAGAGSVAQWLQVVVDAAKLVPELKVTLKVSLL